MISSNLHEESIITCDLCPSYLRFEVCLGLLEDVCSWGKAHFFGMWRFRSNLGVSDSGSDGRT